MMGFGIALFIVCFICVAVGFGVGINLRNILQPYFGYPDMQKRFSILLLIGLLIMSFVCAISGFWTGGYLGNLLQHYFGFKHDGVIAILGCLLFPFICFFGIFIFLRLSFVKVFLLSITLSIFSALLAYGSILFYIVTMFPRQT